jgi:hypothetical protein
MSDVRFICSECQQHLACDDAWCGNVIACPACGKQIQVPHFVVFARGEQTSPPAAAPPTPPLVVRATRSEPSAWSRAYGLYSEADWDQRSTATRPMPALRYILGILAVVGIVGLTLTFGSPGLVAAVVLIGAAFGAAGLLDESGGFLRAAARIFLVLVAFAAIAVGVLFVGCAGACNNL